MKDGVMSEPRTSSPNRRPRKRLIAFCHDRKGATAVEFALIGPPFLALFVGIIQIFLVFFGQQLLEQVVQQAGRLIMTGQAQAQQLTQSQFHQKVCDQVAIIFSCNNLMVDVESYSSWSSASTAAPTLTFNAQGQVTNTWQYSPGSPGDIVIVTVSYQWPVFLGPLGFNLSNLSNGNRLLSATAAFQNEP
jgi:Flp pilus assembly protein TadG